MRRRLARGLLRLCLLAWPARRRHRHGPALLATAMRLVAEAGERGPRAALEELVGEVGALLREGLRARLADLREGGSRATSGLLLDARFALRGLARSPGFSTVSVLTLALGIGGSATVFSLVEGVLLQSPAYERPDDLVLVWNTLPGSDDRIPVAGPDAAVLSQRARGLTHVAFTIRGVDGSLELGGGEVARHVRIAAVTRNFFSTLGVSAAVGRTFDPAMAAGSGSPTVLLSHALWNRALGADPSVVGRELRVNGSVVTVAGVMPRGFSLALPPDAGVLTDVDVWLPLSVPLTAFHREGGRLLDQDSDNTGAVVARLAPGTTLRQARTEASEVAAKLRAEVPAYGEAGIGFDVRRLTTDATAHARPVLLPLGVGVVVVLLVATLNLVTLLVARGLKRAPEFAVRSALGAGRSRILRQLLVESTLLVGLGLVGGLVLARSALAVAGAWVPPELTPAAGPALEVRSLVLAVSLAIAVALLCGLVPGLHAGAGRTVAAGVRDRGVRRDGPVRRGLVAAEIALSVALVLGAGLLLRTVGALEAVRPGFEPEGALTFKVSLRIPEAYRSPADRAAFMADIAEGVGDLPGVEAVGLVGVLPLEGRRWTQPYGLPGQARSEWAGNRADFRVISSGSFEALGTRVLEGRGFTPREDEDEAERVVVVDRILAERIAPDGSAVGAVIGIPLDGAPVQARVVGVVERVRYDRLDADGRGAIYVPYRQEASREVSFVVRSNGDPTRLGPAVRRTVQELDPRLPVYDLRTLEDYVDEAVAPRRFALTLLGAFAGLALLCAAIGLYGVVAFEVARRRRDIGVRMAIGATRRDVVGAVVVSGLRLAAVGLTAGAVLGAGVGYALRRLVFAVDAADPLLWLGVVGLVLAVTLLATGIPATRASRLDPREALRVS